MNKAELLKLKAALESELKEITDKIAAIELNEKPYEAVLFGYSSPGRSSMFFKTEVQARKKFEEYSAKTYYRSGSVDGTALYLYHDDGTRTLLDFVKKTNWWRVPE